MPLPDRNPINIIFTQTVGKSKYVHGYSMNRSPCRVVCPCSYNNPSQAVGHKCKQALVLKDMGRRDLASRNGTEEPRNITVKTVAPALCSISFCVSLLPLCR